MSGNGGGVRSLRLCLCGRKRTPRNGGGGLRWKGFRHGVDRLLGDPGQILTGRRDDGTRHDGRTVGRHPDDPHRPFFCFEDDSDQSVWSWIETDDRRRVSGEGPDQKIGALLKTVVRKTRAFLFVTGRKAQNQDQNDNRSHSSRHARCQ
ncbi:hypothetical protein [Leptospirillum ferriphilum]|uniref:hypothetical protein n=1 Tax=Leptospirillum ferriphilum TaxID=178606 RepID=UPI0006B191B4|nr:hypothetical protein [Leptospirillum ferriphilum]